MRREVLLAGMVVLLSPMLTAGACRDEIELESPIAGPAQGNNARVAVLATEGGKGTEAVGLQAAKANFSESAGKADFTIAVDGYHDIKGMDEADASPGVFFNAQGTAVVMSQPDADGNGIADTFLIATENNLPNGRLERGLAYVGPYTDNAVIEGYRRNNMAATYTGKAGIMGTVGDAQVNATGSVSMKADFVEATIRGDMTLSGAEQFDAASFSGNFTSELSDFSINTATLSKNGLGITGPEVTGSGSFIGAKGQGTIGTFAKSSKLAGTGEVANVHGWFIGSADSLK